MSPRLADDGSRRVETGVICVTAACACVRPPRMRLVSFAVPRDVQAPHCASCAPCTCQFARHCPTTKHTGSCPSRTRTAPVPSPSGTRRWPRILRDSITTSRRGSTPSPGISLKPSRSAAVTRPPACSRATSISVYLSTNRPQSYPLSCFGTWGCAMRSTPRTSRSRKCTQLRLPPMGSPALRRSTYSCSRWEAMRSVTLAALCRPRESMTMKHGASSSPMAPRGACLSSAAMSADRLLVSCMWYSRLNSRRIDLSLPYR
jgi:hypothetical protein